MTHRRSRSNGGDAGGAGRPTGQTGGHSDGGLREAPFPQIPPLTFHEEPPYTGFAFRTAWLAGYRWLGESMTHETAGCAVKRTAYRLLIGHRLSSSKVFGT